MSVAAGTGAGDGYRVKGTAAGPASAHDEYTATLDPGKQLGTKIWIFCLLPFYLTPHSEEES